MESKTYKALSFDFDGTLFDTAKLNSQAYRLAYYDLGIEITEEQFERTRGLSVYEFNRVLGVDCDVERLRELKASYYEKMCIYAKPNRYLLDIIRNSTIPVVLVTTARLWNILPLIGKYNLQDCFSYMVTQDSVKNHKPHPDAYLEAIKKLGVAPEDILAFEDSRAGFVAARAAGCDCVKVGEFRDDCIVDMTGGSNSRTRLLYHEGQLVVQKDAVGEVNAEKLKKECEFLVANKHPYLIPVDRYEMGFEQYAIYTMPYVWGGSFYEYQNKIGMFPEVINRIAQFDAPGHGDKKINTRDIREECFEKYIIPGLQYYEQYAGKIQWNVVVDQIPRFVNDFRITRYHGDTTFENIIMSRTLGPVLIDPVPYGNAITGIAHDFSKLCQSLCGYEAIRDRRAFDYTVERQIFDEMSQQILTSQEYCSLKFYTACLFFRRLKYQVRQDPSLVSVYGDIGIRLLTEFIKGNYHWSY